jgi:ABC-2 type transport system permease protein
MLTDNLIKCIDSSARNLLRNPVIILLLLTIPVLFFSVTRYTTNTIPLFFKLSSVSENTSVSVSQREMALVFIALAVSGLLSSLLAFYLIHEQKDEHKRLILCGYRPGEIILSKFMLLMAIILIVSLYIIILMNFYLNPSRIAGVALGLLLAGFVYGSYGMLIGTFIRGDLEGILFIVLLANIDVGWLQNPVYYLGAQNREFIRSLPAYYPSQVSIVSAFSQHDTTHSVLSGLAYGTIFLSVAIAIYYFRMRIHKVR